MMTEQCYSRDDESGDRVCPMRGFEPCLGSDCAYWRFRPLMADAAFLAAVKSAADSMTDETKAGAHNKAVQEVTKNRAKYGLPDKPFEGFCGAAGVPVDR